MDRRRFLGGMAGAAAFTIVPRHVLAGAGQTPPSEKLNIAGNIAVRMCLKTQEQGLRLAYDGATMQITNLSDANKYVRNEYREGWSL